MPRTRPPVISALLFASACSPAQFDWPPDEASRDGAIDFAAYRASFVKAAGSELVEAVPRAELLRRIEGADHLWLGDHHRHSRLHALQLELLGELRRRGVAMAFGLEAIGVRDQPAVDRFLAGEIDLATLRERMRTRWSGSWLDDRDLDPWFFRSLLRFAREHRIPVFALEPTPRLPLARRDEYIARTIAAQSRRHPERLTVTLVGQSHLLGRGDVVRRSGVGGVVIGGLPPTPLLEAADGALPRGHCWLADSGVYWFGEMFRD